MTPRVKFIWLVFISASGFTTLFQVILQSDYARRERAYFTTYPYEEWTQRTGQPYGEKLPSNETRNRPRHIVPLPLSTFAKQPPHKPLTSPPTRPAEDTQIFTDISLSPHNFLPSEALSREKDLSSLQNTLPQATTEPSLLSSSPLHDQKQEKEQKQNKNTDQTKDPAYDLAQKGYQAYVEEDYDQAVQYFSHALVQNPHNRPITLQLAYAHKKLHHNPAAARAFRQAIDLYGDQRPPFPLRREVEQLENRFEVNQYFIYRDEATERAQIAGPDLTQSQVGLEVSYQPPGIGFRNGRKFQIYTRLLASMKRDRLALNRNSFQGGLGLRIKPFTAHNLVLSAERLIRIGRFARHDWMLRAGYSRDRGTDYREDVSHWASYSLYLDAALIRPQNPDIFLTGQAVTGYNFRLLHGVVLQPRLTALLTWQKDSYQKASLMEAGPGVNLRYYFNDTPYEAYRSYIDLTAEYRLKIFGNSIGGSGPVIGLQAHF